MQVGKIVRRMSWVLLLWMPALVMAGGYYPTLTLSETSILAGQTVAARCTYQDPDMEIRWYINDRTGNDSTLLEGDHLPQFDGRNKIEISFPQTFQYMLDNESFPSGSKTAEHRHIECRAYDKNSTGGYSERIQTTVEIAYSTLRMVMPDPPVVVRHTKYGDPQSGLPQFKVTCEGEFYSVVDNVLIPENEVQERLEWYEAGSRACPSEYGGQADFYVEGAKRTGPFYKATVPVLCEFDNELSNKFDNSYLFLSDFEVGAAEYYVVPRGDWDHAAVEIYGSASDGQVQAWFDPEPSKVEINSLARLLTEDEAKDQDALVQNNLQEAGETGYLLQKQGVNFNPLLCGVQANNGLGKHGGNYMVAWSVKNNMSDPVSIFLKRQLGKDKGSKFLNPNYYGGDGYKAKGYIVKGDYRGRFNRRPIEMRTLGSGETAYLLSKDNQLDIASYQSANLEVECNLAIVNSNMNPLYLYPNQAQPLALELQDSANRYDLSKESLL